MSKIPVILSDSQVLFREGIHFTLAGEDRVFHPAEATIDGNTLILSSEKVKEPVSARYGWSNWTEGNLFNRANLPASSFRTDTWPIE